MLPSVRIKLKSEHTLLLFYLGETPMLYASPCQHNISTLYFIADLENDIKIEWEGPTVNVGCVILSHSGPMRSRGAGIFYCDVAK
jgi:hypothetical protein